MLQRLSLDTQARKAILQGLLVFFIIILLPTIYHGWGFTFLSSINFGSYCPNPFINIPTTILFAIEFAVFSSFIFYSYHRYTVVQNNLINISDRLKHISSGDIQNITDLEKIDYIFEEDPMLGHIWSEFKECIPQYNRRNVSNANSVQFGNAVEASHFFNWDTLVVGRYDMALFNLIPSILTGLGITGTFYGIITGLAGMNIEDPDKLMGQTAHLIGAMQTAFVASFFGIIFSLLYSYLNKYFLNRMQSHVGAVPHQIDRLIPRLTSQDILLHITSSNQDIASYLGVMVDDGERGLAKKIGATLNENLSVQFDSLNAVLASLSGMDSGALSRAMGDRVSKSIESEFTKLATSIERMHQWQQDSMTQLRETIQQQNSLVQSQQGLLQNIEVTLSKTNTTTGTLEAACQSISNTMLILDETTKDLSAGAKSLSENLPKLHEVTDINMKAVGQLSDAWRGSGDGFIEAHKILADRLTSYSDKMKENIEVFAAKFDDAMAKAIGQFNDTLNEMNDKSSDLNEKVSASVGYLDKWLEEIKRSFDTHQSHSSDLLQKISLIPDLFQKTANMIKNQNNIIEN